MSNEPLPDLLPYSHLPLPLLHFSFQAQQSGLILHNHVTVIVQVQMTGIGMIGIGWPRHQRHGTQRGAKVYSPRLVNQSNQV